MFGEVLERRLELSEQQSRQIREILQATRRESAQMRREMRPRIEELLERTRNEIEEVLTPEQRERFEKMRRQRHRRMDQFLLGPPPGPRERPGRRRPPRPEDRGADEAG